MLVLLTMLAVAHVQEPMHVITHMSWERRPEGAEPPSVANLMGLAGLVTIQCYVERDGPPTDCRVEEAIPEGAGFEAAALAIAPTGRLKAATIDGQPVRQAMRFQVRFEAPPAWQPEAALPMDPGHLARTQKLIESLAEASGQKTSLGFLSVILGAPVHSPDRAQVDVAEDRVGQVRSWMDELGLRDVDPGFSELAEIVADDLTAEELSAVRTVEDFRGVLLAIASRSNGEIASRTQRRRVLELRRRYCERYDCRQPEPAG